MKSEYYGTDFACSLSKLAAPLLHVSRHLSKVPQERNCWLCTTAPTSQCTYRSTAGLSIDNYYERHKARHPFEMIASSSHLSPSAALPAAARSFSHVSSSLHVRARTFKQTPPTVRVARVLVIHHFALDLTEKQVLQHLPQVLQDQHLW